MNENLAISDYLNDVLHDWQGSREAFPKNVHPKNHWPIPFFGNPATALVATIGVNPSSEEFATDRRWPEVNPSNRKIWKTRLKNYFNQNPPAHIWFDPWRIGLALLDCSYDIGTATHIDVSYRPTTGMVTNPRTDQAEFRTMAERDVQWLFKLLPLCPQLRVLLTMGPIASNNRMPESLIGFLFEFAPRHGFKVIRRKVFWELWNEATGRVLVIHEADTADEKCITCRVVKNLHTFRDEIRERLA